MTQVRLAALRDSWQLSAQTTQDSGGAAPAPKKKGVKRWFKKYWYVPVLVAVGVGVAVSDDGADGPNDPED